MKERVRDITGLNAKIAKLNAKIANLEANLEDSRRHASYEIYDLECDNRQLRSQVFQLEREWHDMRNALFRRAGTVGRYPTRQEIIDFLRQYSNKDNNE